MNERTMRRSSRRSGARADAPTGANVAFVTVGTTRFDALIAAVDDPAFEAALIARGVTSLVVQAGAGPAAPSRLLTGGATRGVTAGGLEVEWLSYEPTLAPRFAAARLVVSHAGAGSLFEALAARAAVVAVPNPSLMGNHQAELAASLEGLSVLVAATTDTLAAAVATADFDGLVPYEPDGAGGIAAAVDALAGRRP